VFFQIGFGGIGELHFDAPAVDGMHTFEGFSATGTGLFHRQKSAEPSEEDSAKRISII
jgi:hypothetical protein